MIKTSDTLYSKTMSRILRSTPQVDDSIKKDPCTDEKITGNQITIVKNKSAVVLNQEKNWFLVLEVILTFNLDPKKGLRIFVSLNINAIARVQSTRQRYDRNGDSSIFAKDKTRF